MGPTIINIHFRTAGCAHRVFPFRSAGGNLRAGPYAPRPLSNLLLASSLYLAALCLNGPFHQQGSRESVCARRQKKKKQRRNEFKCISVQRSAISSLAHVNRMQVGFLNYLLLLIKPKSSSRSHGRQHFMYHLMAFQFRGVSPPHKTIFFLSHR